MTGFELFLQQLINGLTLGAVIALVALGYALVYSILGFINFAHGDVYMLAGFFALTLAAVVPWETLPWAVQAVALLGILLATAAFSAAVNFTVYRLAYRRLVRAPGLVLLVSAIGASFILQNIGLLWGAIPMEVMGNPAAPKSFPDVIPRTNLLPYVWPGTAIQFTVKDLLVLAAAIPTLIALELFITRTRWGKAVRAVSQDPAVASLMGINVERVIFATFLLGGALAGVAALVNGLYINRVEFTMGYTAGMRAFTAAVVGGLGSLPGAVVGGFALGIVAAMSDQYLSAQWTNAILFLVLVGIIVFRPSGLLKSAASSSEKV